MSDIRFEPATSQAQWWRRNEYGRKRLVLFEHGHFALIRLTLCRFVVVEPNLGFYSYVVRLSWNHLSVRFMGVVPRNIISRKILRFIFVFQEREIKNVDHQAVFYLLLVEILTASKSYVGELSFICIFLIMNLFFCRHFLIVTTCNSPFLRFEHSVDETYNDTPIEQHQLDQIGEMFDGNATSCWSQWCQGLCLLSQI